jgi:hypothetical protein
MRSLLVLAVLTSTAHALPPAPPYTPNQFPDVTFNQKGGYYELRGGGGVISTHDTKFREIENTKLPIRVLGECGSACTIVLRNPLACAERAALFGFHQALKPSKEHPGYYEYAPRGTYWIWSQYPEIVQKRLGKLTPQMVWVKGYEIMPTCEPPIKPTTCLHKMLGSPLPC